MALKIIHSSCVQNLAHEIGTQIQRDLHEARFDFFDPICIVVPHPNLGEWLKLRLADKLGVSAGIEISTLERALWNLLESSTSEKRFHLPLTSAGLQQLILSLLMSDELQHFSEMEPVWKYIGFRERSNWGADGQRKAWQLAGKLTQLLPEYERQRAPMIAAWNENRLLEAVAGEAQTQQWQTQQWQQRLYYELFKTGGWRDRTLPYRLTLPQLRTQTTLQSTPDAAPVYWFGFEHLSSHHFNLLCDVGKHRELFFYLPALCWREGAWENHELLRLWGKVSCQTFEMTNRRAQQSQLELRAGENAEAAPVSGVLPALQREIRTGQNAHKTPQDKTLQIWGCPGIHREIEVIYNLILRRLEEEPTLRLSEIAVVATDVSKYLPYLQDVFSRHDNLIPHNISDAEGAQSSFYSMAVSSLLGLVDGKFTRREVFDLLQNPCFLTAVGADAKMPRQWLQWTDALGIFHAYDLVMKTRSSDGENRVSSERDASSFFDWSDSHTWLAGLRRLRLGRIMKSQTDAPRTGEESDWRGVIPFEDLETAGPALDRFSYAVELLFQQSVLIGNLETCRPPSQWSEILRAMLDACLAIPPDSQEETTIRYSVQNALNALAELDACFSHGVVFAFAKSYLLANMEEITVNYRRPLVDGVTITSPRLALHIPFRDIYVLGLSEGEFPGTADRSTLDLRIGTVGEGDLTAPETNRQRFLDLLLAARDRLVLTYSNRDLEKDAELGPCSLISQLKSYLERQVFPANAPFREAAAPLHGRSTRYLFHAENDLPFDALVNYDAHDYRLALTESKMELISEDEKWKKLFDLPLAERAGETNQAALSLKHLKYFLVNPAEEMLRRRLHLSDDESADAADLDIEPFVTEFPTNLRLGSGVQSSYVTQALQSGAVVPPALDEFFDRAYEDAHKRSLTPDGVFKELDKKARRQAFEESVHAPGGLRDLLDNLRGLEYSGVSIGALRQAKETLIFPEVKVTANVEVVALSGHLPFIWRDEATIQALVLTDSGQPANLKIKSGRWQLIKHILEPLLFFAALQCGDEKNDDGFSSRDWVGNRRFVLHLTGIKELQTVTFNIPPAEAVTYLENLVAAYKATARFEDIPLASLCAERSLWPLRPENEQSEQNDYTEQLQIAIEDAAASSFGGETRMELLSLMKDLQVPSDAREKIEQRLMPLYSWRVEEQS